MKMVEYKTIDEYIERFPEDIQSILRKIRHIIREITPGATEKISYGMPAFWHKENLVYFAAMKNHIGFYPTAIGVAAFADKLTEYKTSKGAIQFPLNQTIPYDLISEITRWRLEYVTKNKG